MILFGIVIIVTLCIVFTNDSIVNSQGTSKLLAGHFTFNVPVHFADHETVHLPEQMPPRSPTNATNGWQELQNMNTRIGPIFDQGPLGSCVANALVAAFDYIDDSPVGSRLFLQQNSRQKVGTLSQDSGTTVYAGVQALTESGLCFETKWPQIVSKFATRPSNACYVEGKTNRLIRAQKVATNVDSIKKWLSLGYPVVIGILVQQSFMSPQVARTGDVGMPLRNEKCLGGHAVVIVGQNDTLQKFKVRNSWGSSWGQSGYFTMPQAYFSSRNLLASDGWTLTQTI